MSGSVASVSRRAPLFRWTGTIARYLLIITGRRFVFITLGLTGVLLLERLLRLLDFVVAYHASTATLATMLLALTPYYLSLSIPAAALISLLLAILALRDSGELNAIVSWGVAIGDITWFFSSVAAALCIVLILMTGDLNPHARYAFRKAAHEAKFISAADVVATRPTFWRVGEYDIYIPSWAGEEPVMLRPVLTRRSGAVYDTIEALRGRVHEAAEQQSVTLILEGGRVLRHSPVNGAPAVVRFNRLSIPILREEGGPFRSRGADEREMTLAELLRKIARPAPAEPRFAVELHMRLVRALSVLAFPLLAFSACAGPPRSTRLAGPALAIIGVLSFHFLLIGLESLAMKSGDLAMLVLWTPFVTLTLILFVIFRMRTGRHRENATGAPDPSPPQAIAGART